MKKEDIEFLKHLSDEFRTQNDKYKLHQSDPTYIGIMDYKWVRTDDAEEYHVIAFSEGEYTLEEFAEELWDNYTVGLDENGDAFTEKRFKKTICDFLQTEDLRDFLLDIVKDADPEDFEIVGVREEEYIVENAMFLTWKDAVEHLKSNKHHYTTKAHPYAMTAFRSPSYERLHNIIKETDWSTLSEEKD